MANYPIKMLKDENGTPFVPLVAPGAINDGQGFDLLTELDKKLEKTNIIAGDNVTITTSGNDITINSAAGGASANVIDNLDQTTGGVGVLDAHQGHVLKEMIPDVVNNLTTVDGTKALSAYQGYLLNHKVVPTGGATGQVLKKKSATDNDLEWGDAADPNAISGDSSVKKIVALTYEEYQQLVTDGEVEQDTEYHIIDAPDTINELRQEIDDLQDQIDILKIRKSNPILKRCLITEIAWGEVNKWAQMPFDSAISQDSEFNSWSYNNGVFTVGANVSRVRVKSTVAVNHSSWVMYGLFVNDNQVCKTICGSANTPLWYTLYLDKVIDVNPGDEISLRVYKDSSGSATLAPLITTGFKEGSCVQVEIEILE